LLLLFALEFKFKGGKLKEFDFPIPPDAVELDVPTAARREVMVVMLLFDDADSSFLNIEGG
jgi:hypothetical protein